MELATLGIAVDSRQVRAADSDLKKLSDTGARTERSLEGVGAAGRDAARGSDATARSSRDAAMAMDRQDSAAKRLTMSVRYFAAAALAAGAASVAWAASMTRHLDQTSKMAQQIGVTTEALTGMRFAAQQFANISDQQFDMSMRRMTRRIEEAAAGGGAAKGALDALGLSARELSRLSPDQQMLALADAMAETESQAQRLQYTMALFDTEGMALVPALQQGSAALREATEMAQRFGVILSTDLAQAAEQFTNNMSLLNSVQQGYRQEIAERLLPSLVSLTDRIVAFAAEAGPAGERVEKALKTLGVVAIATAAIIAGRLVGSITASTASWVAATAAAARYQMQLVQLTASIGGASAAITGLSAAASGAMTVMARAARGISGVLGGPLGVIAATGLAATAFLTMGRNASSASVDVDDLSESLDGLTLRQLRITSFNLENELVELSAKAEVHGQILRGLKNDYDALADAHGVTEAELRSVRQAIDEEEEALEGVIATIAKKSPMLAQITQRLWDMDAATRGLTGSTNALNQAMGFSEVGEKYLGQIQARIKALQDAGDPIKIASRYIAEHTDLTEADRVAIMSAAHAEKALLTAREAATKATKSRAQVLTDAQRAAQAFRREQDQSLRAQLQSVSAIHAQAQALEDQVALFGQSATAIEDLTIARLEEQAAILRGFDGSQEQVEAIEREIEARQRLRTAIGSLEQKEAERQAWEAWARDVEQIFDRVGQSLTDAIFDGGKSGRDLLKDLFKGLTFNILINPIMNQMQGWVTNQLGGLFGVQNPQQGGGMFGTAQNLYSGYNAITGGLNSTLGNAAQWLGQKIGSEALTSFGLGLSGTAAATGIASIGAGLGASLGTTIGTSAAAMTTTTFSAALGGGAAAGGAAAGGAAGAAGIGSAVGAALPWIGGALAIGSAFGLFDDRLPTTRRSQRSTSHMLPDGSFEVAEWDDRQDTASQIAARDFAEAAVKHANDLFERIGIDAQIHSFQALMESSILGDRQGVGSSGQVRIGDVIRDIGLTVEPSWTQRGFGGWSDQPMLPRLQTDIQLTILEAFQAAGDQLPSVLSGMLEDVDIRSLGAEQAQALAQSFQMVIDQVSLFQGAVESLPFAQLRDLSFDAAANLIQFAGGLEQLDAGMTSYFQNFYSEAEQLDWLSKQVSGSLSELGLVMPDVTQGAEAARAAYRALVESLDLTTEEGQRAYATLMTLSGGFAELTAGMDQLADAASRAATQAANDQYQEAVRQLDTAWAAVQRFAQQEISRLQETFAVTDAVYQAFQQAAQAAQRELQQMSSATDAAYRAASRAAQATQRELQGVVDALSGHIRDLLGDVDSAAQMQYEHARAVIGTALVTGQLPQTADLTEALQIARRGVTDRAYASSIDQERAYIRLSNEMEALRDLAEPELDAATATLEAIEKQYNTLRGIADTSDTSLETLRRQLSTAISAEDAARRQSEGIDRQLEWATEQYNALRGIEDLSGLSLGALQGQLAAAIATEEAARVQIVGIQGQLEWATEQYNALMGIDDSITDLASAMRAFASGLVSVEAARKAQQAPSVSREQAYMQNNADVRNAFNLDPRGMTAEQYARWHFEAHGRREGRSFASGGFYPGGFALVGERGPEIINFKNPGQVYTADQSQDILRSMLAGSGQQELLNEVRALRQEVAQLRAEARETKINTGRSARSTEQLAEQFDQVTEGGNAQRTVVMEPVEVVTA